MRISQTVLAAFVAMVVCAGGPALGQAPAQPKREKPEPKSEGKASVARPAQAVAEAIGQAVRPGWIGKPQPSPDRHRAKSLGDFAWDLLSGAAWEVLSDKTAKLLADNRADLLSGNKAEILSGNEAEVLSGNQANLLSGNRIQLFSNIRVTVRFENSGNHHHGDDEKDAGDEDSQTLREAARRFRRYDRDGDGLISLEEFEAATADAPARRPTTSSASGR